MDQHQIKELISQEYLDSVFPIEKGDQFFEALYGDASEGAYDIRLELVRASPGRIVMAFNLTQRPGKCLACNLTYGLPNVFDRHPVIDVKGMVNRMRADGIKINSWHLGQTEESSAELHQIPIYLDLE